MDIHLYIVLREHLPKESLVTMTTQENLSGFHCYHDYKKRHARFHCYHDYKRNVNCTKNLAFCNEMRLFNKLTFVLLIHLEISFKVP